MNTPASTNAGKKNFKLPFKITVEQRLNDPPGWFSAVIAIGAVILALLIGALVIAVSGGDPLNAFNHIVKSSFGSVGDLSDTLQKSIPLMIVGLACAVAFRMKVWNIGAEGQFYVGMFGASAVVLIPLLPDDAPKWLWIIAMMLGGMIMGAIWGFIPGILKAKVGVNEIITTLMMNYIAESWNNYFVFAIWSEAGFEMSKQFPKNTWLPKLSELGSIIPAFKQFTTVHLGLLFAFLAAVIIWFILYKSKWGYEIRLIGDNPHAAKYAGISIAKNIVLVMMLSGALAGLAGMAEIGGVVHRFQQNISPGYGFTGIIIAWLAKLNPWVVLVVSVFFGALIRGGREIQPSGVPTMIQGVIFVFLIASDFIIRNRISISRREEI